jgi:hypothetical protein
MKKPMQKLVRDHRHYFLFISKCGKDIEKIFRKDSLDLIKPVEFDQKKVIEVSKIVKYFF